MSIHPLHSSALCNVRSFLPSPFFFRILIRSADGSSPSPRNGGWVDDYYDDSAILAQCNRSVFFLREKGGLYLSILVSIIQTDTKIPEKYCMYFYEKVWSIFSIMSRSLSGFCWSGKQSNLNRKAKFGSYVIVHLYFSYSLAWNDCWHLLIWIEPNRSIDRSILAKWHMILTY